MSRLTYNVSNSNPLIPRQQTYVLDRKLVSIHSEDRDIKKYPQSNKFNTVIVLLENAQSVRTVEWHSQLHIMVQQAISEYQDEFLHNLQISLAYHNNIAAVSKKGRIMTIEIQEGFTVQKT